MSPTINSAASRRHRFQKRVHERHVDHGGFVDNEEIGVERVVLILAEAARLGIGLKQPVDGLGLLPRCLAHAFGGAARRRAQKHLHVLGPQNAQDRVHDGGLADARPAGDDEHLRGKGEFNRLLLTFCEREIRFGCEPGNRFFGIDLRPGGLSGRQPQDALRDPLLGLVQPAEKNAFRRFDAIANDALFAKLQRDGRLDQRHRHFEELFGESVELFHGQSAMAVIERFGERIRNAGPDPDHGGFLDAKLHGNRIGGFEADAAYILGQPVRVFRHDLHGIVAVGLVDAHRAGSADAVRMQKDHDLADDLLLGPGSDDALGPARPDALHLAQAAGGGLDDIEDFVAEGLHQAFGVDGADAADHAGGEVFLHALDRGWRRGFEELRPELQSMGPVVLPAAAGRHPLPSRDRRSVTDGGDEILMAAGFHAKHAEAVLLVVEGHPFHKAGKNLALFVNLGHDFAEKASRQIVRLVGAS